MGAILGVLIAVEVLDELLPGFEGTIGDYGDFDCEGDCNTLHDALHGGVRIEEEVLIEVLCNRSNVQRQEIQENYEGLFGESLYDRIDRKVRRDKFRHVLKGLLLTPLQYDAKCLHEAMRGIGSSDDDVLAEILSARPNGYIEALKVVYEDKYGDNLMDRVCSNTRSEYERFLVALLCAAREEGVEAIDAEAAVADAQELFDAGEERWLFTDEAIFTRIMARRSWMQIKLINAAYTEIAGMDLEHGIDEEIDGVGDGDDLRKAYKAVVRMACDPARYFSRNMYKAMRGLGTDDDALQRALVFTSEWGLETIKQRYEEEHGNSLADDIDSECRGDYNDVMLAIVK